MADSSSLYSESLEEEESSSLLEKSSFNDDVGSPSESAENSESLCEDCSSESESFSYDVISSSSQSSLSAQDSSEWDDNFFSFVEPIYTEIINYSIIKSSNLGTFRNKFSLNVNNILQETAPFSELNVKSIPQLSFDVETACCQEVIPNRISVYNNVRLFSQLDHFIKSNNVVDNFTNYELVYNGNFWEYNFTQNGISVANSMDEKWIIKCKLYCESGEFYYDFTLFQKNIKFNNSYKSVQKVNVCLSGLFDTLNFSLPINDSDLRIRTIFSVEKTNPSDIIVSDNTEQYYNSIK